MRFLSILWKPHSLAEGVLNFSCSGLFIFEEGIEETNCLIMNPGYTLGMIISKSLYYFIRK